MRALILFDIDGTLIGPCRAHARAMTSAITETYGVEPDIKRISPAGMTDWQIIYDLVTNAGVHQDEISAKLSRDIDAGKANNIPVIAVATGRIKSVETLLGHGATHAISDLTRFPFDLF